MGSWKIFINIGIRLSFFHITLDFIFLRQTNVVAQQIYFFEF